MRVLPYKSEEYIDNMVDSYLELVEMCDKGNVEDSDNPNYEKGFVLDCSNGVGAIPIQNIMTRLKPHMEIILINKRHNIHAKLNHECGAEFVQRNRMEPMELTQNMPDKVACFDGDASRLIYFKRNNNRIPLVIDGDK